MLILLGLKSFVLKEIRHCQEVLILRELKACVLKEMRHFSEVLYLQGLGRKGAGYCRPGGTG